MTLQKDPVVDFIATSNEKVGVLSHDIDPRTSEFVTVSTGRSRQVRLAKERCCADITPD